MCFQDFNTFMYYFFPTVKPISFEKKNEMDIKIVQGSPSGEMTKVFRFENYETRNDIYDKMTIKFALF